MSGDAEPGETPVTCTIDGVNKTGTACDVCNGTDYSTTACNTVNGYDQDSVCVINDTTKYKCKAHDCGPGYVASCGAGYEIDTTQPVCKSAGFDKYKCKESTSESEPLVTCTIDGISKTGTECDVCNTADYTVDDCSAGYEIEHTCVIGGVSKHKCKVHNCGTTYKLNVAECGVGYQLSNTDTCQSGPDIKKKCVCAENSAFSDVVISNPQKNGKIRGYINDLCRCNNGYSVWNNTCKSSCTSDQYRDSTTGECVSGCPNLINAYTSDTNMENQGCCGYALIKQGGGTWVQYTSDINNIFSSNGLNTTNLKGASTSKYIGIALTVDSEGVCKCPSGLYEFPDGNFRLSDNTVVTPDSDASGVYNNTVNEFVNKDVYCDLVITE